MNSNFEIVCFGWINSLKFVFKGTGQLSFSEDFLKGVFSKLLVKGSFFAWAPQGEWVDEHNS